METGVGGSMNIENRAAFFPRHYRIQPVRYERVYDAWGAVFKASNGDEYIIVLHVCHESIHKTMLRNLQQGRPMHNDWRDKIVDGAQVFLIQRGRPLHAITQILHSLNHAVEVLEARFEAIERNTAEGHGSEERLD